ncbi:hypothetical protein DRW03_21245 [Corallococcus sp. H22C18031201]|nr:hypothetical protein DRW03_21245 [Corallococcus sp. H22C18031201]
MPVRVKFDVANLQRLRSRPQEVLRALDMPLRATVRQALDYSMFMVPRGDPSDESNLAGTGFISGPHYNMGPQLSGSWTAGYSHEAAGAIHEGFHWGAQIINPPPHFLKKAFRRSRAYGRKGIATTLEATLARIFSPR